MKSNIGEKITSHAFIDNEYRIVQYFCGVVRFNVTFDAICSEFDIDKDICSNKIKELNGKRLFTKLHSQLNMEFVSFKDEKMAKLFIEWLNMYLMTSRLNEG